MPLSERLGAHEWDHDACVCKNCGLSEETLENNREQPRHYPCAGAKLNRMKFRQKADLNQERLLG